MPNIKNAAEAGANMNGCLIWAVIGFVLFLGASIGSSYLMFMGLILGGAMLGGKALSATKTNNVNNDLFEYSNKSFVIEESMNIAPEVEVQTETVKDFRDAGMSTSNQFKTSSYLSQSIEETNKTPRFNQASETNSFDLVNELERLADLKSNGYLSEKEYSDLKANIIYKSKFKLDNKKNQDDYPSNQENNAIQAQKEFTPDDLI